MKIHLARHGQALPYGNYKLLSPLGREQVLRLAHRLGAEGFGGRLYASPYCHTLFSAQLIAETLGLRVRASPELREIVQDPERHLACFQGATAEQMRTFCDRVDVPQGMPERWWACERAETSEDVKRRVAPLVDHLCDGEGGESACLVAHGASIIAARRHLAERFGLEPPHTIERFNCSLITFALQGDQATIEHYYDNAHLPREMQTSNHMCREDTLELIRRREAASRAEAGEPEG